jgi:hypothetical protein
MRARVLSCQNAYASRFAGSLVMMSLNVPAQK